MITLRLQRVTFLALHDYLGLSEELINPNAMTSLKRSNSRRSTNSFSSDEFPRQKTRRSTLASHEAPPLTESTESRNVVLDIKRCIKCRVFSTKNLETIKLCKLYNI